MAATTIPTTPTIPFDPPPSRRTPPNLTAAFDVAAAVPLDPVTFAAEVADTRSDSLCTRVSIATYTIPVNWLASLLAKVNDSVSFL
jgi:hypothetical protein